MDPKKRYQVFVSSTFQDLKEERQQVIQALLELDCIPSGMELFPAANEDQWSLIKRVIDDCDYYLVIVAGRYGSVDVDGIGYTEKEYRYAVECSKPIIAFLHEDPNMIVAGKSEQNPELKAKLAAFRELCQQKMCKNWASPTDLGGKVSRSLIHLIKNNPAIGWVRGDAVPEESTVQTINQLREANEALKAQVERIRKMPPKGAETLAQGKETVTITCTYKKIVEMKQSIRKHRTIMSWDDVFKVLAPCMLPEGSEYVVRQVLRDGIVNSDHIDMGENTTSFNSYELTVDQGDYDKIMIQLRALGLIRLSDHKRSVKDRGMRYWSLTDYGDEYMTRLMAIPTST
jgi:hypothetical protein